MSNSAGPTFADWLRDAMDRARMPSQSALGKDSGINPANISRWLQGDGAPDLANCRRLAPVLRVPMLAVVVAAGHLSREEAQLREIPKAEPIRVSAQDAIAEDTALSDEARVIVLAAYRAAVDTARPQRLRAVARKQTEPRR